MPIVADASSSSAMSSPFGVMSRQSRNLKGTGQVASELAGELALGQEIMDKVRGLESKLDYQIKKLVGLAEAVEARGRESIEDIGEGELYDLSYGLGVHSGLTFKMLSDPLSFRPNPSAMVSASISQTSRPRHDAAEGSDDGVASSRPAVYRPPRISAMPYNEPGSKTRRTERRAPALLSEFATTMDGTPLLESTSGLSTRPVQADRHTNSTSAKRAAELERINRFEEENMMRLVTSKREGKRRRDDEAALAMGYGVGGPARSRGRKQNGLEAELEGVLGDRRSKGLWEGVGSKLGKREGVLAGGEGRGSAVVASQSKKARFERDIRGRGKRGGRT